MTAPTATPSISVPTHSINGDLIIYLSDALTLVSSKSEPGKWRAVEDLSRCTCRGFEIRGRCRHVDEARQVAEQDRCTATPMALSPIGDTSRIRLDERDVCVDCGQEPQEIGVRCSACHAEYWNECEECGQTDDSVSDRSPYPKLRMILCDACMERRSERSAERRMV